MVLNFLTILSIAYWSSGVWLPPTLKVRTRKRRRRFFSNQLNKIAVSTLRAMNSTADQYDTAQVHISNGGFSTWDPSNMQIHDQDDEDEDLWLVDDRQQGGSWNGLDAL